MKKLVEALQKINLQVQEDISLEKNVEKSLSNLKSLNLEYSEDLNKTISSYTSSINNYIKSNKKTGLFLDNLSNYINKANSDLDSFLSVLEEASEASRGNTLDFLFDVLMIIKPITAILEVVRVVFEILVGIDNDLVELKSNYLNVLKNTSQINQDLDFKSIGKLTQSLRQLSNKYALSHSDYYSILESFTASGGKAEGLTDLKQASNFVENTILKNVVRYKDIFNKSFSEMSSTLGEYSYILNIDSNIMSKTLNQISKDIQNLNYSISNYLDSLTENLNSNFYIKSSLGDLSEVLKVIIKSSSSSKLAEENISELSNYFKDLDDDKLLFILKTNLNSSDGLSILDDFYKHLNNLNNKSVIDNKFLARTLDAVDKLKTVDSLDSRLLPELKTYLNGNKYGLKLLLNSIQKTSEGRTLDFEYIESLYGINKYLYESLKFNLSKSLETFENNKSSTLSSAIDRNISTSSFSDMFEQIFKEFKTLVLGPVAEFMFSEVRDFLSYLVKSTLINGEFSTSNALETTKSYIRGDKLVYQYSPFNIEDLSINAQYQNHYRFSKLSNGIDFNLNSLNTIGDTSKIYNDQFYRPNKAVDLNDINNDFDVNSIWSKINKKTDVMQKDIDRIKKLAKNRKVEIDL